MKAFTCMFFGMPIYQNNQTLCNEKQEIVKSKQTCIKPGQVCLLFTISSFLLHRV